MTHKRAVGLLTRALSEAKKREADVSQAAGASAPLEDLDALLSEVLFTTLVTAFHTFYNLIIPVHNIPSAPVITRSYPADLQGIRGHC